MASNFPFITLFAIQPDNTPRSSNYGENTNNNSNGLIDKKLAERIMPKSG
jgi:hypothetical protein